MKKFFIGALFSLLPCCVLAEDFYVGGLFGATSIDSGIDTVVGATLDEDDSGYSFMIGSEMNDALSVEGFYTDFGEASLAGDNGDTFVVSGTTYTFNTQATVVAAGSTIGVAGKLNFDMTENFSGFFKGGMHWWEIESTLTAATGSASATDSGSDLLMGLGAEYDLGESAALVVGYDKYSVYSDGVTFFNAGLKFKLQ
jgi:hypothetical protein